MCPRCRGTLIPEADRHGSYRTCLACGYVAERIDLVSLRIDDIDPIGLTATGQRRKVITSHAWEGAA